MQKRALSAIFLSTIFLAGCHMGDENAKPRGSGIAATNSEQQVRESVLSYLFDNNASAFQKNVSAFCVRDSSISGHEAEASNALALLMKQTNPKVEPYTACQVNKNSSISFSGKSAIEFTIAEVSKVSDNEYLVRAGYYEGNLSSQNNQYTVKRKGNDWTVSLKELGPIS